MKPKGGRGKIAPYQTKLMRVPVPVESQVMQLCDRYREFIESGGNPASPPPMLESPNRSQQETPPSMLESKSRSQLLLGVRTPGVRGNRRDGGRLVG